jgi:hypothetical protein
MKSIKHWILDYASQSFQNENSKYFKPELVFQSMLQSGFEFKGKTPKATVGATCTLLFQEGKLTRIKNSDGYHYSHPDGPKRIFSEIDPYGEEDWEN